MSHPVTNQVLLEQEFGFRNNALFKFLQREIYHPYKNYWIFVLIFFIFFYLLYWIHITSRLLSPHSYLPVPTLPPFSALIPYLWPLLVGPNSPASDHSLSGLSRITCALRASLPRGNDQILGTRVHIRGSPCSPLPSLNHGEWSTCCLYLIRWSRFSACIVLGWYISLCRPHWV